MRNAVFRECRLIWIFRRSAVFIMILAPVIFYLLPYARSLRGVTELEPEILAASGLFGTTAYMIFYIVYEVMKCERESKSLEMAAAFGGIGKVVCAKSAAAAGTGLLCALSFYALSCLLWGRNDLFSASFLGINAANALIYAFFAVSLLCLSDGMAVYFVIASFPAVCLTIGLIGENKITALFLLAEAAAAFAAREMLKKQMERGKAGWLK